MEKVLIDGSTVSVSEVKSINRKGIDYVYYNISGVKVDNPLVTEVYLQDLKAINVLIAMIFDFASTPSIPTIITKSNGFGEIQHTGIAVNLLSSLNDYITPQEDEVVHGNRNLNKVLEVLRESKSKANTMNSFSTITSNTEVTDTVKEELPELLDYSDLVPNPYEMVTYTEFMPDGQPKLSSRKIIPITVEDSAKEQGISVKEAILKRNSEILAIRESLRQKDIQANFGANTGLLEASHRVLGDSNTAKDYLGY